MNPASGEPGTIGPGEPTWEIAQLFPNPGQWSEDEYLALNSNHLVEFADGYLELLPMPTELHQLIAGYLYRVLAAFVESGKLGIALTAPFRVRLRPGKFREPDVLFMLAANAARRKNLHWDGADLVMGVVSEDRDRDLEVKAQEYAQAGIPRILDRGPAQFPDYRPSPGWSSLRGARRIRPWQPRRIRALAGLLGRRIGSVHAPVGLAFQPDGNTHWFGAVSQS